MFPFWVTPSYYFFGPINGYHYPYPTRTLPGDGEPLKTLSNLQLQMTRKRTVTRETTNGHERVKYIERDHPHYTERMVKPVKPRENNVTGSYAHICSSLRVENGSAYCRDAHVDVYENGRKKKQVPLTDSSMVAVTSNETASLATTPTTVVPTDTNVSSMGFSSPRVSVDNGTAVAFLPANQTS